MHITDATPVATRHSTNSNLPDQSVDPERAAFARAAAFDAFGGGATWPLLDADFRDRLPGEPRVTAAGRVLR